MSLDSYNGHQFLIRLVPHVSGVETKFRKGKEAEDVTVTYDAKRKSIKAMTAKQSQEIKTKVKNAQEKAARGLNIKPSNQQPRQINATSNLLETIDLATDHCRALRGEAFSACMASNLIEDITRLTDAKTQLSKFRDAMSSRLRNYTCVDETMQTSAPVFSYDLSLADKDVQVNVLLNKTHSKIWTVDNFISDAECDILQKHGKPLLRRATVAAEDGSSVISENRKANQAAYNMQKQNPETDPLW